MKKTLWTLHFLFVVLAVLAIWVLSQDAPGSHPHPGVFLPLVVLIWLVLHLVIAITQIMLWRGDVRLSEERRDMRWPAGLVLAVVVYLYQLSSAPGLFWRLFTNFEKWSILHSVSLVQLLFVTFCMVTVLLRWPIARYLAGVGILAMAVVPVFFLFLRLFSSHSYSMGHFFSYIPSILLIGLGVYLLRSEKVQLFLRG